MLKSYINSHYCADCKKVSDLESTIQTEKSICKDFERYKLYYEAVLTFNRYNESIINIISQGNNCILVTAQIEHDYLGKIKNLNLYAYKFLRNKFKRVQEMFTELCYSEKLPRSIHIIDFRGEMNKGYGSIVMSQFLLYVKALNLNSIKRITGFLSLADADHWDLLYHFYGKFGFQITEENDIKHIILKL